MREATELSFACLYLFNNKYNYYIECIDSVTFYRPVMLSSISHFKAYVTYKERNLLHTVVEIYNIVNNEDNEEEMNLTTALNITFKLDNKSASKDKFNNNDLEIIPESYSCGIRYLDGRRRLKKLYEYI